ncbi:MAG TPA: response regulator [Candidatus Eisenbacteria bacterium]|nr:response regulator [Candidatus Eisenbacteria bacterium]
MMKILLVEDSRFLRIAMERALARAGYKVVSAEDGLQAIEVAGQERPNLILLDMLLPKMSGQEVLAALKNNPSTAGIAVVACTGLSPKNAARLKKDGVCAFLDKSALELEKGSEKLLAAVAEILRELPTEVPRTAGARA